MIKKIVCPTDFSSASTNAIEYASKLAQRMNLSLTLLHVQKLNIGEGVSMFSLGERESETEAKIVTAMLNEICNDIKNTYQVTCDYAITSSLGSFEKTIEDESKKYDLVIIGTNGADDSFQFYFGSHSIRIAKHAWAPVLIIPEECSYSDFKNILFVSDYHKEDILSLHELKEITDCFLPNIKVIHISEKNNVLSDDDYSLFSDATNEILNLNNGITIEKLIHKNEENTIENLTNKFQSDLLAICIQEHGFVYQLFHKSLITDLTTLLVNNPILIFHK